MARKADNNRPFSVLYHDIGKKLNIKGNEILVYSIIDNYTKNDGACKGGFTSLAETLNCRVGTAQSVVNSLLKKGLIERIPTNDRVKYYYRTVKNPIIKTENTTKSIVTPTITENVKEEEKTTITENQRANDGNRKTNMTETETDHDGKHVETITENVNRNNKRNNIGNNKGNTHGNNIHSELNIKGEENSLKKCFNDPMLIYDEETDRYCYDLSRDEEEVLDAFS